MSARSKSSTRSDRPLVARLWHGATPAAQGDAYAAYLQQTGVKDCRATPGNHGAQVLRRTVGDEAHLLCISCWGSLAGLRAFAGAAIYEARDYRAARKCLRASDR